MDLVFEQLLAFSLVAIATVDLQNTFDLAHSTMQGERDRLAMMAHQDALTGCFNRLALDGLKQNVGTRRGTVIVIDLNYLKPLNDEQGHAVGDLTLGQVSSALKTIFRPADHVFRVGGDEFVILRFGMSSELAVTRMERVQATLATVVAYEGHTTGLSIAFGTSKFTGSSDIEEAITQADARMYAHKRAGRAGSPR